jgi:hypothetical protein
MKKTIFVLGLIAAAVSANILISTYGCTSPTTTGTGDKISNKYAILPTDINEQKQSAADLFSWQTFIAMNWPADLNNCGPDTSKGMSILTGKGPVVWETYLSSDQVFVSAPLQPAKWCNGAGQNTSMAHLPPKVLEMAHKTGIYRFIHRISKAPHGLEQAVGGPLVDQNGRFVRYEVRMNQDEYNYIIANSLWDTAGQNKFHDSTIVMPAGPTKYGPTGAMEFKAAWKILGNGDDPSRFYKIKAIVYNDDSGDPSPGPNPVTLGLVGLHIARKTANQRNWVWSTFEQVDNLTKSFYNAKCDTCKPNQPLPPGNYKELDSNGKPLHPPTQVTRVNPIDDPAADSLNKYFQNLLKGSVWANYQLVSTQWLFFEDIAPLFLANSVQETYVQGPNPPTYGNFTPIIDQPYYADTAYHPFAQGISASCMGCHYVATFPYSKVRADFSFMLGEAH